MEKNKKIILGVIIAVIVIMGIIAVVGSFNNNFSENSSDGLATHKIEGFKFKAPEELEWDISMAGTNGFLKNDIYEFNIGITEDINNLNQYTSSSEYKSKTVDGITYKYTLQGWEEKDGLNFAQVIVYFEKNGTIFEINCVADEDKGNKEFIFNTTETIIKTMTPT